MTSRHDYPELTDANPAPVIQVRCHVCHGTGWKETHVDPVTGLGSGWRCVWCAGTGHYWTEADHAR